jgi:hypothetical protein
MLNKIELLDELEALLVKMENVTDIDPDFKNLIENIIFNKSINDIIYDIPMR